MRKDRFGRYLPTLTAFTAMVIYPAVFKAAQICQSCWTPAESRSSNARPRIATEALAEHARFSDYTVVGAIRRRPLSSRSGNSDCRDVEFGR